MTPALESIRGRAAKGGEPVPQITAAEYAEFQNLEEVKEAIEAGRLSAADAHAWEVAGKGRKSYLAWLSEQINPIPAPEVKASGMEKVVVVPSREEVAKRLRNAERGYMLQKERVRNPALPVRADEVRDWMPDFMYYWVPCPPRTRAFHPMEHQNLDKFLRAGWEFYPFDYIATSPNPQGLPWHPSVERDGTKVRWNDHWLMYRSADYERRAQDEALRRWNSKREVRKGDLGDGYVGTRVSGETTVDKVLRERDDDAQDRDAFPR